jgi:hypothetical protein
VRKLGQHARSSGMGAAAGSCNESSRFHKRRKIYGVAKRLLASLGGPYSMK